MGILNLTPDSFYATSREMDPVAAARRVSAMVNEGADIIDIGACSTRPGSAPVSADEEMRRLSAPLEAIRAACPEALVSIDTFRADVARECVERWNVDFINDISGGADPEMFATVAKAGCGYVLMHNRGFAAAERPDEDYGEDVAATVLKELAFKVGEARLAGVCNLIVDPGFGFGKTTEQNFRLLACLDAFKALGCPVLVGLSRKKMVREACECDAADSLSGTIALNAAALMNGASIIRVHDVEEGAHTARSIGRLWREAPEANFIEYYYDCDEPPARRPWKQ